jgi:hypothetical protein
MKELDKYEILEEIGRGAFAVVYRARDNQLGRFVALKVLHPQLTVDPRFVERFKREAQTTAGLDHAHIATVYEVGEIRGQLYIALELARGSSLAECIQEQGPLSRDNALKILEQVASALDYAHEQGFVHRDIKPSNILLDPDKGALLGDFGLSKVIESSGYSLTASGGVLGTPAYIAPEIWAGERPTPASDIYALGCVLYEMITGEVLFGMDPPLTVMKRHDEGAQLDTHKLGEGLGAVLLKALEKSSNERYQRAGAFAAALRAEWRRLKAEQEEKQRQERVANLLAQGRHAAREKRWDSAIASLETVLEVDAGNQAARRALARARQARERAMQTPKAPQWAWALFMLAVLILVSFGLLGGMARQGRGPLAALVTTHTPTPILTATHTPTPILTATHTPTPILTATPTATSGDSLHNEVSEEVSFGSESMITTAADGASSVYAADVDSDGDMDVLSASYWDDKVTWYENNGGSAPAFTDHVIATNADGAWSVYAADVDGDGDMDILSASELDDKIAWYENNGGSPPAFTDHVIATNADQARSVFVADVDGDDDLDVLSASIKDNKIAWYENNGGSPPAFTSYVITTDAGRANSVHAADVDGDGDMDVLSASNSDSKIAWYENNGGSPPAFTGYVITTDAAAARWVYAADVDKDGDLDVLSASYGDGKIAWYENDGGSAPAFTDHVIATNAACAESVYAADVDGDGDMDVLSASYCDSKVAWYRNNGGSPPAFTGYVITNAAIGAMFVYTVDVDGDGDMDVLSASTMDDKIAWYENQG